MPPLGLATGAGLRVPQTLVTNNPEHARAFIAELEQSGYQVVSKSPADLRAFPAQTEVVSHEHVEHLDRVRLSPTVFQERIKGGPELRITVVGQRLFGMAQFASAGFDRADGRLDPEAHREEYQVPDALRVAILTMQQKMGLRYGAYDFKCGPDGTPYFLEVNPVGQWLFAEAAAGLPITEALARMLWLGPGAEWGTHGDPITREEFPTLFPFSFEEEYAALLQEADKSQLSVATPPEDTMTDNAAPESLTRRAARILLQNQLKDGTSPGLASQLEGVLSLINPALYEGATAAPSGQPRLNAQLSVDTARPNLSG